MKKKIKTSKPADKLVLARQTLRTLSSADLGTVGGAWGHYDYGSSTRFCRTTGRR